MVKDTKASLSNSLSTKKNIVQLDHLQMNFGLSSKAYLANSPPCPYLSKLNWIFQ